MSMNFRHLNRLEKLKHEPHRALQEDRTRAEQEAKEMAELEAELQELEIQENFEVRQRMEQELQQMELEMRDALGLPTSPEKGASPAPAPEPEPAPRPKLTAHRPPKVRVRIAVQAPWGGPIKSFEYVHKGISIFEARTEACKAARKAGLQFRYYLDETTE